METFKASDVVTRHSRKEKRVKSQAVSQGTVAYRFDNGVYLNLTNRCPTRCVFCAKVAWKYDFHGNRLALGQDEPSIETAWAELYRQARRGPFREVVFCGFGEPTYRLSDLLELSRRIQRTFPRAEIRLNTIGLGSLIHGRGITERLARVLDSVRVSLNTADELQWRELHNPLPEFAEQGFCAALAFVAGCVERGLDVAVTAIELPGVDLVKVENLAQSLGARFICRPQLVNP